MLVVSDCSFLKTAFDHLIDKNFYSSQQNIRTVIVDLRGFHCAQDVLDAIDQIKENEAIGHVVFISKEINRSNCAYVVDIDQSFPAFTFAVRGFIRRPFNWSTFNYVVKHSLFKQELSERLQVINNFIKKGYSVAKISQEMELSKKMIYHYIGKLKEVYQKRTLSAVYHHIQNNTSRI